MWNKLNDDSLNILIVEDDKLQYEFIHDSLKRIIKNYEVNIQRINTESDFYHKFPSIMISKPDVVIMDVMLRWADPSLNIPTPPPEVVENGFYRAGIRCVKMLEEHHETKNIPIIIYSVLDKNDLENELPASSQIKYIDKDFNPESLKDVIMTMGIEKIKDTRSFEPEERW